MPANPYVTVPAMPRWMQQLWLQQYLAARNQPRRPSIGEQIGVGLAGGLDQGLGYANKNWTTQAELDSRLGLTQENNAAQAQRQQDALQFQYQKLQEIEQAKIAAEHRKQAQEAAVNGTFWQNLGTPTYTTPATTQSFPYSPDRAERGGAEGLTSFSPMDVSNNAAGFPQPGYPSAPSTEQGYREGPAATATISPPSGARPTTPEEALMRMGYAAGLVPPEMIQKAIELRKTPAGLTPEQKLAQMKNDYLEAAKAEAQGGPAMTPEMKAFGLRAGFETQKEPPKGWIEGLPGPAQLIAVITAQPGDPLLSDPRVLRDLGPNPQIRALEILYGQGGVGAPAGPQGGLLQYEGAVAQGRGFGAGYGQEMGKQAAPMGTEAQNWIDPKTLAAAPQGLSEQQARASGYVAISPKQKDEVDAIRSTTPLVDRMRQLFDPAIVGPWQGRISTVAEMMNLAPQSFADLRSTVEKYRSEAARAAAGSAIGPAEREIYFSTYPDVKMSPQQFQATLGMVETGLRIARNRIVGGQAAPLQPEVSPGQHVTLEGVEVIIDRANPDGSLAVHDARTGQPNVWRPR
jgi:hypothetical protein